MAIGNVTVAGLGAKPGETLYIKLRVVDHAPGRYVQFIWEALAEATPESW